MHRQASRLPPAERVPTQTTAGRTGDYDVNGEHKP